MTGRHTSLELNWELKAHLSNSVSHVDDADHHAVPASQPDVGLASIAGSPTNQTYLVMMTDPDAPSPTNRSSSDIIHWLAPNQQLTQTSNSSSSVLPYTLVNTTENVVPYARSRPPVTSTAHRYMQWLFVQPPDFAIPEAFSGYNAMNRSLFNLTEFISAAGLGNPVAANYFLCSNGSDAVGPYAILPPGSGNGTSNGTATSTGQPVATQTTNSASVMGVGGVTIGVVGFMAALVFW